MHDLETKTIELRRGYCRGADLVTTITMREPTVQDNLAAQDVGRDAAARELALFATICGVSVDELKTMTMADYGRVQEAYRDFLD